MKKGFTLAFLILFLLPVAVPAQEEPIGKGETLTLQQVIDITLEKQPSIGTSRSVVSANESRVGQALSNYYPQISLNGSYSRIKPLTGAQRVVSTGAQSISSFSTNAFNQYTGSANLSQNIYDFGRTSSHVGISKFNLEASRADLDTTVEQVVFTVKQAYFGVLQAERNRVVAKETVKQYQLHLDQAKGFYEVGTKPKYDVTQAEVNLSNAKLNLLTTENALKVSRVTLNNAMGVPGAPEFEIQDNLSFQKYPITLQKAIETAYDNRPDLKSLSAQIKSLEKSIDLAKADYYPFLTGSGTYTKSGSDFPLEKGWNLGVALTFPVFNGFLTKYQVSEAKANLQAARSNEETLKQSILLDVQQSYLNLTLAEDSISVTALTVKQATENLDIANGRYAAGVGNTIEVSDAEVQLVNAKTSNIQALYNYKVATASLERAMGLRQ